MKENEQESSKSFINHTQISDIIVSKDLGDIFTIDLPENVKFTEDDVTHIDNLFNQSIKNTGIKRNLSTNSDFILCLNKQNKLTVYKDSSWNLRLFQLISEEIQRTLDKYPKAYPFFVNMLVEKIPETQRNEIGYLPIKFTDQFFIDMKLDSVPTNVLRATVRLINDPNKILL
ncbi:MAG: hypothetical protein ABIJ05_02470 [Patescibacteria group bacterium]